MRMIFTASVVLLGMGTSAHAVDILAAGPIFDPGQKNVSCGVFNAGAFPVAVLSTQIFKINDPTRYGNTSDCVGPLTPGSACRQVVSIDSDGAHSCVVRVRPSKANIRGTFDLLDPSFNVVVHAELR